MLFSREKVKIGEGWAVLHVDPQVDFMEGGSLAIKGGHDIIEPINRLTDIARHANVPVVMSADWHPQDTAHFTSSGGPWPEHCIAGTAGAAFGPGVNTEGIEIFYKGMSHIDDGYSPWEGRDASGEDLDGYFRRHHVTKLIVDGLATDYCVKAGVLGGLDRGYSVYLAKDAIRPVNKKTGRRALSEMRAKKARLVSSRRISG